MPQPAAFLPSPYGLPIPLCYLRDVRDVFTLLTAWKKGQFPECTRRLKDAEKHAYITSGWCVLFSPDPGGVLRWTDQLKWTPSRVQGPFFVYRQLDASCSRSRRPSPHYDAALSRRRSNTAPSTSDNDEWSKIEFERWLVSSWTNNGPFTRNGLCRKTIAVELYEREYRIVSYYSPLDVRNGNLVRASDHPAYAGVELDPQILREAKYKTREKNEVRIRLLSDLLDGGSPRTIETIIRSKSTIDTISTSGSSDSSIYPPILNQESRISPGTNHMLVPGLAPSPTHRLGLDQPNIHWVPIESVQAPQVPLALEQQGYMKLEHDADDRAAFHELEQQGYMKLEHDADDRAALQSISRMQSFAPPAGPPRSTHYGLPTPLQPPKTQRAFQEDRPDIYELSHALNPRTERGARRPLRIRSGPSPASDNTIYMSHAPPYPPPLTTSTVTMPLPLCLPPTPPLSGGEEQAPALCFLYNMYDRFMPLSATPLPLPDTMYNFNSALVSAAHEQNAPFTHGHTRF